MKTGARPRRIEDRPVVIGFIGAGNVLGAYLQSMDRLLPTGRAVLGGIYARNPRRRKALAATRPGITLCESLEEALAAAWDVAVVITPPATHMQLAHRALKSGKHVLVEKPLALRARDARALVRYSRHVGKWLVSAPFVHLSPTFTFLAGELRQGTIGTIHSARGLYGNSGSHWALWYHEEGGGPLADLGIYNLKSLTCVLGPVQAVFHRETRSGRHRVIGGKRVSRYDPDVAHTLLMHRGGATSQIVSSHAIVQYDRPALEFYGTSGTANLRGDDWDPRGVEIWRAARECWQSHPPIEPTWHWTDGLADLVQALREGRPPISDLDHDLHLLDVLEAAAKSAKTGRAVAVRSRWDGIAPCDAQRLLTTPRHRGLHDHTRPRDAQ
jgi:predicted dehydrogenase